jgi:hypothetical protein
VVLLGRSPVRLEVAEADAAVGADAAEADLALLEEADQVRPRHLEVVCGLLGRQLRVEGGHGDGMPLRDLQKATAEEVDGGARQQEHAAVAELQAQLEDVPERRQRPARLRRHGGVAPRRRGRSFRRDRHDGNVASSS